MNSLKMVKKEILEGLKDIREVLGRGAKGLVDIGKKIIGIGTPKGTKLIIIFVLIALAVLCYFLFIFTPTCSTQSCFTDSLWKCKRVVYTSYGNDSWHYSIEGMNMKDCEVKVTALSIKSNPEIAKSLEGKEMTCYLPRGTAFMPESKIEYCHGLLKEEIQDQIIKSMHLYIVENIGEIKELPKIV